MRVTRPFGNGLRHSGDLCRERLKKGLLRGRKVELVLCRLAGLGVTILALAVVLGWLLDTSALSVPVPSFVLEQAEVARQLKDVAEPVAEEAQVEGEGQDQTREIALKKGEGVQQALERAGLSQQQAYEITRVFGSVHDVRKLKEGTRFYVTMDEKDGVPLLVRAEVDVQCSVMVEKEGDRFKARKELRPVEVRARAVSGVIEGSLWETIQRAGMPSYIAVALAQIFDYDIDFHTDLRRGDRFDLLVEERWVGDTRIGYGRILAARFVNRGKTFWAFYFEGKGTAGGYFDRDGRSLKKAFLKSPLKFTKITSGFSHARIHPILGIYRPHLGVDYAAPAGTPVRAVADGKVVTAGWNGGFGNQVTIQHGQNYLSMYGHLSKLGHGIRTGAIVRQGQIIGYVGATGLATGPHLDFRLVRNGQFINPQKVNFMDGEPVSPKEMASFKRIVSSRIEQLENGSSVAGGKRANEG